MNKIKSIAKKDTSLTILIIFTLGIIIFLGCTLGTGIFNLQSLSSMGFQVPEFAILAIGMAMCMLLGGIDLSIISNANMAGIVAGFIMTGKFFNIENMSVSSVIAVAVVTAVVVASVGGFVNGILIARFSVPPLVATLGTMTFYNGIGMALTSGKGIVGFPDEFLQFGAGEIASIPYIFIVFVVIAVVMSVFLERSTLGKQVYFIGENHTASRFAAVNNEKVIMLVYTLAGMLAGISSLMIISRVNSAKVGYGDTYQLQAILTAVLGGVSPSGGKGRLYGVVLAVVCLQLLQTAFTQWEFSPYSKKLIWGFMLLAVMLINMAVNKYVNTVKKRR